MSVAKAFVSGTVVKSPEKRFTQNDMAIVGFTINIDQNNETLLRVVAFGQLAETVSNTVAQGDKVAVEGKLQVNSFKTPNGKDKKVFEINASTVEKMTGSSTNQASIQENNGNIVQFENNGEVENLIDEEEIPF